MKTHLIATVQLDTENERRKGLGNDNTVKPAYYGTAKDRICFRCRQVKFSTGT